MGQIYGSAGGDGGLRLGGSRGEEGAGGLGGGVAGTALATGPFGVRLGHGILLLLLLGLLHFGGKQREQHRLLLIGANLNGED